MNPWSIRYSLIKNSYEGLFSRHLRVRSVRTQVMPQDGLLPQLWVDLIRNVRQFSGLVRMATNTIVEGVPRSLSWVDLLSNFERYCLFSDSQPSLLLTYNYHINSPEVIQSGS